MESNGTNNANQKKLLRVSEIKALNLQAKSRKGSSNVFCQFKLGNQRRKTEIQKKNLNPIWDDNFHFILLPQEILKISLWHRTRLLMPKLMATLNIPMDQLLKDGKLETWFELHGKDSSDKDTHCGQFHLKLTIVARVDEFEQLLQKEASVQIDSPNSSVRSRPGSTRTPLNKIDFKEATKEIKQLLTKENKLEEVKDQKEIVKEKKDQKEIVKEKRENREKKMKKSTETTLNEKELKSKEEVKEVKKKEIVENNASINQIEVIKKQEIPNSTYGQGRWLDRSHGYVIPSFSILLMWYSLFHSMIVQFISAVVTSCIMGYATAGTMKNTPTEDIFAFMFGSFILVHLLQYNAIEVVVLLVDVLLSTIIAVQWTSRRKRQNIFERIMPNSKNDPLSIVKVVILLLFGWILILLEVIAVVVEFVMVFSLVSVIVHFLLNLFIGGVNFAFWTSLHMVGLAISILVSFSTGVKVAEESVKSKTF